MGINQILKKLELKYSPNTYSPNCANQTIGVFKLDDEKFHIILGYLRKEIVDIKPEDLEEKLSYADLGVLNNWGKEYIDDKKNIDLSVKDVISVYKDFIDSMIKVIESSSVEEVKLLNGNKITKSDDNFFDIVRQGPKSMLNKFYKDNKEILNFIPSVDYDKIINSDNIITLSTPVPSDKSGVLVGKNSEHVLTNEKLEGSRQQIDILKSKVKESEFRDTLKTNISQLYSNNEKTIEDKNKKDYIQEK